MSCSITLEARKEAVSQRLQKRNGHFMPPELLDSQFDALEEPDPVNESVMTIEVEGRSPGPHDPLALSHV
jgi:gluconokinase